MSAAARPGFSMLSTVITVAVVAVVSLAAVRISWGVASGSGAAVTATAPDGGTVAPGVTGAPDEVAGQVVLSTHGAAIASQVRAAAALAGGDAQQLSDAELLAGYPSSDGTNTVTATVASRTPLLIELGLNGGTATSCLQIPAGMTTPGPC